MIKSSFNYVQFVKAQIYRRLIPVTIYDITHDMVLQVRKAHTHRIQSYIVNIPSVMLIKLLLSTEIKFRCFAQDERYHLSISYVARTSCLLAVRQQFNNDQPFVIIYSEIR